MKNKILIIIGVVLIVAGAALSYFAGFAMADVTGFAVSMFGAGVAAAGFWEKRKKTDVLSILTVVCIGVGAFLLGFGGFVESTMTTIITDTHTLTIQYTMITKKILMHMIQQAFPQMISI